MVVELPNAFGALLDWVGAGVPNVLVLPVPKAGAGLELPPNTGADVVDDPKAGGAAVVGAPNDGTVELAPKVGAVVCVFVLPNIFDAVELDMEPKAGDDALFVNPPKVDEAAKMK